MPLTDEECKNIDNDKNLANINDVVNCVVPTSLTGFNADSVSPSDTYMFDFKPGTKLYGMNLRKGFMKMFVSDTSGTPVQFGKEIGALRYEIFVYYIVKNLVNRNVNGHFVKTLGGAINSPFNKIVDFLTQMTGLPQSEISRNLYRNTNFMTFNLRQLRPAITNNKIFSSYPLSLSQVENFKYGFVLTEGLEITKNKHLSPRNEAEVFENLANFLSLPDGKCTKYSSMIEINYSIQNLILYNHKPTYDQIENSYLSYLITILFQCLTVCYSLFINRVAHNDLHAGNVLVRKTPLTLFNYNVVETGKTYSVYAEHFAKIFDWDKSYAASIGNNAFLQNKMLFQVNQTNEIIQQRDFIKLFCYFYSSFYLRYGSSITMSNTTFMKNILNAIVKLKPVGVDFNPVRFDGTTNTYVKNWWNTQKRGVSFVLGQTEENEYQDFWDLVLSKNRNCFLNNDFIDNIHADIYKETLYTLPEIMENLYNLKNPTGEYYISRVIDPSYTALHTISYNMQKI